MKPRTKIGTAFGIAAVVIGLYKVSYKHRTGKELPKDEEPSLEEDAREFSLKLARANPPDSRQSQLVKAFRWVMDRLRRTTEANPDP